MELNLNSLATGLCCEQTLTVSANDTAAKYGSGLLEVFATPALVALMEKTAISNLDPHLPNGYTTVGTRMDVKHVKASPVGANVQCHSELTAIEGRRLVFHIDAFDEKGRIGEAVHERFVVNKEHFMNKLQ